MKNPETKKRKPKADAHLDDALEANSRKFSIRVVGEEFHPVLHCAICATETPHEFLRSDKGTVGHYLPGIPEPRPRFGKGNQPIEMDIDLWACSQCKTERVYGSA